MKLYKPVLIESVEQAEALPVGTVAVDASSQSDVSIRVQGGWHCTGYCLDFGGSEVLKHSDMVGDQALVPIEAEEEWGSSRPNGGAWECHSRSHAEEDAAGWNSAGPGGFRATPVHRLVTPWRDTQ